ncbi:hypothetical protein QTN25_006453 [Entamoeba marina]
MSSTKSKEKRPVIKKPTKFVRSHMGFNQNGELEMENLPPTWVAFFKKAHIKKAHLQDKETRDKVFKLMSSSSLVRDMDNEVRNNPNAARSLQDSCKPNNRLPEGMTTTPITRDFIKKQKESEVSRILKQNNHTTSTSSTSYKKKPSVTPKKKQTSVPKKNNQQSVKKTSTKPFSRNKLNIPSIFTEEKQSQPLTYYEKMELKKLEKPKTFDPVQHSYSNTKPTFQKQSVTPKQSAPQTNSFSKKSVTPQKYPSSNSYNTPVHQKYSDNDDDDMKPTIYGDSSSSSDDYSPVKQPISKPVTTYSAQPTSSTNTKSTITKPHTQNKNTVTIKTPVKVSHYQPTVSKSKKFNSQNDDEMTGSQILSDQRSKLKSNNFSSKPSTTTTHYTPPKQNTTSTYSSYSKPSFSSTTQPKTTYSSSSTYKTIPTPSKTTSIKTTPTPSSSIKTTPTPSKTTTTSIKTTSTPSKTTSSSIKTTPTSSFKTTPSSTIKETPKSPINSRTSTIEATNTSTKTKTDYYPPKKDLSPTNKQSSPGKYEPTPKKENTITKPGLNPKEVKVPPKSQPLEVEKQPEPKEEIPKQVSTKSEQRKHQFINPEPVEEFVTPEPVNEKKIEHISPGDSKINSGAPPPPPPPLLISTTSESPQQTPSNVVSFTEMIFSKSGDLKPTEIEERIVEEDIVISALRGILQDRRKDMNMDDYSEDEDDWSDDWGDDDF